MPAGDHHSREGATPSPRKSSWAAPQSLQAWSVLESRLFHKVFAFGALRVQQIYFTSGAHLEVCKAQSEPDRKLTAQHLSQWQPRRGRAPPALRPRAPPPTRVPNITAFPRTYQWPSDERHCL